MSGKDAPYQWIHTVDYEDFDRQVLDAGWEVVAGAVVIDQTSCHFRLSTPHRWNLSSRY